MPWNGMNLPRRWSMGLFFAFILLALAASPPFQSLTAMPDHVRITRGDARELASRLPLHLYVRPSRDGVLKLNGQLASEQEWGTAEQGRLSLEPLRTGQYHLEMRLYKIIPIRRVTLDVVPPMTLVPGGQSIGVLVHPGGVLVVDMAAVTDHQGRQVFPAREAGVRVGDVLVAINGSPVQDQAAAGHQVARAARSGESIRLTFRRGEEFLEREIRPIYDQVKQRFLLGLWLRDGATGIGTLSFYDPLTGRYGALGHLVTDVSGQPYQMRQGLVINAFVAGIRPGRPGQPGEKIGVFMEQDQPLGTIEKNTEFGIFGRLHLPSEEVPGEPLSVALEGEVHPGPAQILTVINGQRVEPFAVVIERVFSQARPNDKGMVIRVTDPRLLAATGGIVQGMSGSPLIQGGKLIGAVTHVFVNDPTRGYAIFAEWMARELPRVETILQ